MVAVVEVDVVNLDPNVPTVIVLAHQGDLLRPLWSPTLYNQYSLSYQ